MYNSKLHDVTESVEFDIDKISKYEPEPSELTLDKMLEAEPEPEMIEGMPRCANAGRSLS
jgi:alpha,alpha-trehalase